MQLVIMSHASLCIAASLLIAFTPIAEAARKAGGLRQAFPRARGASERIPTSAEHDVGEVVVQLERRAARSIHGVSTHSSASFYVGNITVGQPPQEFQVLFDTGSGHVLLPHKACKRKVCLEHHRYSPWASSTAEDVNEDGTAVQKGNRIAKGSVNRTFASLEFTQADLGDGVAKGVLVRDHVCLSSGPRGHHGHQGCTDLAMLAATDEDAMPFAAMPADGIIGLGLEGLATSALSSFYSRLMDDSHQLLPEFGIHLGATDGKIIFGGRAAVDSLRAPVEWFPVVRPEDGMWQIEILAVRVGGNVIDSCAGSCHAIVDTASSRLGVQDASKLSSLRSALSSRKVGSGCHGPEMQFDLPRGLVMTLSADDYSDSDCEAEVGSLNLTESRFVGVYSLGTNVIRRYYTAFDWSSAQVGFAPNAGSTSLHVLSNKKARQESSGSGVPSELLVF